MDLEVLMVMTVLMMMVISILIIVQESRAYKLILERYRFGVTVYAVRVQKHVPGRV